MAKLDPFSFARAADQPPAPASAAREKTAQELHDDEIVWRNGWRNNGLTASYLWVAKRGDAIVAQEYAPCDCEDRAEYDPTAHRSHFSDLPGKFAPAAENGNPIPAFEATEDFEPFTFVGVPLTLDEQQLPHLSVDVEPGEKIVWGHRAFGDAQGNLYVESQLFGKITADGRALVKQVYPNGDVVDHDSLGEALTHFHPVFPIGG